VGEFVEQVDDDTVQAISAWLDYFYHVTERLFLAELRSPGGAFQRPLSRDRANNVLKLDFVKIS
jgi:hypothetical protein